jgi:hypothetical protein
VLNTNQNWLSILAKVVRRLFHLLPPRGNEKTVISILQLITQILMKNLDFFLKNIKGEEFLNISVKNQCYISMLSVLFLRRNQHALYFLRALYFVRYSAYVVAKSELDNEFSQNIFPMSPHGNGNVGRGPRAL